MSALQLIRCEACGHPRLSLSPKPLTPHAPHWVMLEGGGKQLEDCSGNVLWPKPPAPVK